MSKENFVDYGNDTLIFVGENVNLSGHVKGKGNEITINASDAGSEIRLFINGDYNKVNILKHGAIKNITIHVGNHVFAHNTELSIGKGFTIEPGGRFFLYNSGNRLVIGDNCMFSNNITIRCGESPHLIFDIDTGEYLDISDGVFIGDHVWVGENVYFTKKVTVPNESIVAACSVVTKRFHENHSVLAGNPAKVVKRNITWVRNVGALEPESSAYLKYHKHNLQFSKTSKE